jgi:methionyl-tRNA formyltransferase
VLKVWRAQPLDAATGQPPQPAGTVLAAGAAGVDVACGIGVLRLLALQRAGGKRLAAADFLRGQALDVGMRLGQDHGS